MLTPDNALQMINVLLHMLFGFMSIASIMFCYILTLREYHTEHYDDIFDIWFN
jgi:hypothetical protein